MQAICPQIHHISPICRWWQNKWGSGWFRRSLKRISSPTPASVQLTIRSISRAQGQTSPFRELLRWMRKYVCQAGVYIQSPEELPCLVLFKCWFCSMRSPSMPVSTVSTRPHCEKWSTTIERRKSSLTCLLSFRDVINFCHYHLHSSRERLLQIGWHDDPMVCNSWRTWRQFLE